MLSDKELKKKYEKVFRENPEKYYPSKTLAELGFFRGKCKHCGRFFWSTDQYRTICGDSACSGGFSFIGNTPATKKMDYVDLWKKFSKILGNFGYSQIKRYPVVARWRDDVFFVQASIDDFMPYVINGIVEPPANPLIVPQVCLRFNDIDNVGITGSHYTSFIMVGQHRFEPPVNYKQGEYFRHLYEWFINGLGLKPKDLVLHEDIWAGSGNFGPCIEFFSGGLELANQVYMQFKQTSGGYEDLKVKVLDMGLGYERNVWFSSGKSTSYETTFPTVVSKLKEISGIKYDKNLYDKFLPYAGLLNLDETDNIDKVWKNISEKIGVNLAELKDTVLPLSAIYSIAEHTRSLLIAINDGALPSNVGGGYNLRVLLRRSLSFIDRYKWNIDLADVIEWHAKYLKPLFPELKEKTDEIAKIINVEKNKYSATKSRSISIVENIVKKGVDENELIKLYDSKGITPEMVKQEADMQNVDIKIDDNFYSKVSELHSKTKKKMKKELDISGIAPTKLLFYEKPMESKFSAKVVKVIGKHIILDKTLFYPEGGGQEGDHGEINGCKVYDTQKQGRVVIHYVDSPKFSEGDTVKCAIDVKRRLQLSKHHTAIHIINFAARKVLGSHIFQAGSHKSIDKAHLDITHYNPLSIEETKKIEDLANEIVDSAMDIRAEFMLRNVAEKKYGMGIYQGGAVPGKKIRIVSVGDIDVEACGGLHLQNTKDVGKIIIVNTERIQDGIDRITIKAGDSASKYLEQNIRMSKELLTIINEMGIKTNISEELLGKLRSESAYNEYKEASKVFEVSPEQLNDTIKRFISEIKSNSILIEKERAKIGVDEPEKKYRVAGNSLREIAEKIFKIWKIQKKEMEKLRSYTSRIEAKKLIKKAKEKTIFEVIHADRDAMIMMANEALSLDKNMTVILANEGGDIIGMSNKDDMSTMIANICKQAGGSGGGRKNFAQGRVQLSKLLRIINKQ